DTPDHSVGPFGSGKVTFTGTITNSPCDIAPGDDNLTVNFGQISYRKLKAAGAADTQDVKPVTIHLQNCSFDPDTSSSGTKNPVGAMSMVSVAFTGTADTGDTAYANTPGSGMATGAGVQLLNSDLKPLKPSELVKGTTPQQLQTGDNQINLFAQLINLGAADSVVPGNISIPLNYTLTYK
ncbi:fimbrial protein, partial [Salmonella enterica subsp. enterica]